MQRKNRPFTLIEVCIAVAILGMLASVVGWNLKKMVDLHRFRKHVALFTSDLQKLQVVAMSRRCDLEVQIFKKEGKWFYTSKSDEPMLLYGKDREIPLEGVGDVKMEHTHALSISPAGRIEPLQTIQFISKSSETEVISLDLKTPLLIKETHLP